MAEYNPSKIIKDGNTYNFRDTTKIPLAGSNEISGSLIPSTDGTVNLGSSSYQWNNAYIKSLTINGVACGDILTHNASEFVKVTGNQTIDGVKTFSNGDKTFNNSAPLRIQGCNKGNEFSINARTVLELRSNRDTADKSCIYITKFRQNRAQGSMGVSDNVILTMDVLENEVRTNDLLRLTAHNWENDVPTEVYLEPATKASNIKSFLGSSSRPWGDTATDAINGLNPGALSLPNVAAHVDVTSQVVTIDNGFQYTNNLYDGWLVITAFADNVRVTNNGFEVRAVKGINDALTTYVPSRLNETVRMYFTNFTSFAYVNLYKCSGNV